MQDKLKRDRADRFLKRFREIAPFFSREMDKTINIYGSRFYELADPMLFWASRYLGKDYEDILIEGYCVFVAEVNRAQMRYEKVGKYEHESYNDVYLKTYSSSEFMNKYHWGVYVTTFVWGHHLKIYEFFRDEFLSRLRSSDGVLIDLGSGSGIWSALAMNFLEGWKSRAIDISETSVLLAREFARQIGMEERIDYSLDDALKYRQQPPAQAGISCFLLEHLEQPLALLKNLSRSVEEHGFVFLTCALTAAEIDHIYEFKRESEVALMVEKSGFRVVALLSSSPESISQDYKFLPRSLALVLQKRRGEIW